MGILWLFLLLFLGLIILVVTIGLCLIIYARWNYGTLDNLGFPVIKPHFFLGSNHKAHHEIQHQMDYERMRKYGKVYGVYDGRDPLIFVHDVDMIRHIQSKDFEHFRNHRRIFSDLRISDEILDFLDDEKWKVIRSMLTRNVSTGKTKQFCEIISTISQEYVQALLTENFKEDKRLKMDFRNIWTAPLVLEISLKCHCSTDVQNARDPNNKFIGNLKEAFNGDQFTFDWTHNLTNAIPILRRCFPKFNDEALVEFEQFTRSMIESRQKMDPDTQPQDFINILSEILNKSNTEPEYIKLGITDKTVIGQAYQLFSGNYIELRHAISNAIYCLAMNPEQQTRAINEIDQVLEQNNGKIDYDTLGQMSYLTACIFESLRLDVNFYRIDRRCTKDWEYKGIRIKKGMDIVLSQWAIQHDPDNFEDPNKFDPTRFLPENKNQLNPYAFQAFGQGPRACIGQRLGIVTVKTVLVHLLKEFKFEKRPDTILSPQKGNPFFIIYEPIWLDIVKREHPRISSN